MKKLLRVLPVLALLIGSVASAHAQVVLPHYVTLTWNWSQCTTATPPVCGGLAQGFNILRAPATGTVCPSAPVLPSTAPFVQVGTLAGITVLTYTDNNSATNVLTEGSTYCYIVQSYDQGGVADSTIASATIPFFVPEAPTAVTAVAK
jgi:hypothetical protein